MWLKGRFPVKPGMTVKNEKAEHAARLFLVGVM